MRTTADGPSTAEVFAEFVRSHGRHVETLRTRALSGDRCCSWGGQRPISLVPAPTTEQRGLTDTCRWDDTRTPSRRCSISVNSQTAESGTMTRQRNRRHQRRLYGYRSDWHPRRGWRRLPSRCSGPRC